MYVIEKDGIQAASINWFYSHNSLALFDTYMYIQTHINEISSSSNFDFVADNLC